jgi:hypothetical protein
LYYGPILAFIGIGFQIKFSQAMLDVGPKLVRYKNYQTLVALGYSPVLQIVLLHLFNYSFEPMEDFYMLAIIAPVVVQVFYGFWTRQCGMNLAYLTYKVGHLGAFLAPILIEDMPHCRPVNKIWKNDILVVLLICFACLFGQWLVFGDVDQVKKLLDRAVDNLILAKRGRNPEVVKRRLKEFLKENPEMTEKDIARILGVKKDMIRNLQKKDVLEIIEKRKRMLEVLKKKARRKTRKK